MITYIFRKPIFPVIAYFNGTLIGGKTGAQFENNLKKYNIHIEKPHDVIDATGEVWLLSIEPLAMSPLSFKSRFTKIKLIQIYNISNNCKENRMPYSEKSISNKKFIKILKDILELI
jgi:hypothetical protein